VPQAGFGSIDTGCLDVIRSLQRPGRPDLLRKVIDQFFEDGARQLEAVRSGYSAGDAAAVRGAIHRLKSSSAYLGAPWLAKLCGELEDICRKGQLPADMNLIATIEGGFLKARAQLEPYIKELPYDTNSR
jgi:HPt (histidine-containing phosphotransfer) domain-containing protein